MIRVIPKTVMANNGQDDSETPKKTHLHLQGGLLNMITVEIEA
tara:strand:+ start:97 stop:225 length:129 start_codon:yes stop_codon:yes gene_type:complete